ncbi:uncharacterized protein LOC134534233 [Bacillus rossius redtenbacheri]|uniref:uncharacterized protein LOC134534233 n=1 Tax=Bacillus rossius redtenbacheri TaxID=93214 RepID=UPI002FDE45D5
MSEEEVIISIKSCINSSKGGVLLSRLNYDYRDMMGEDIPFKKLGYSSLKSFISSISNVMISRTAQGEEILNCCGGKSAHIAALVSRQKTTSKTLIKKRVISRPKHVRDSNFQSRNMPTKYGSSSRDYKASTYSKYEKPPRFRGGAITSGGETTAGIASVSETLKFREERNNETAISGGTRNTNGSVSVWEDETLSSQVSESVHTESKNRRKTRTPHSQNFLKQFAGKESAESDVSNPVKVRTRLQNNVESKTPAASRLLRGPSACVSVSDTEKAFTNSIRSHDDVVGKTLTITVSNNKRNVMCADGLLSSPDSPKNQYGYYEDDDEHCVPDRNREQERLGTSPLVRMSFDAQERELNKFDLENSRLVGRVASQRHINMFPGMAKLSTPRHREYGDGFANGDSAVVDGLTHNLRGLQLVEPGLHMVVEPALFHYLLIGDDFFLNLAASNLGASVHKVGNRLVSCGLCHSGQSIKMCLARLKRSSKLLSKAMLLLGAVDILEGCPIDTMKCEMVMLVNYLCSKVNVIVALTVPPLPLKDDAHSWKKLREFNTWLVEFVGREYSKVHVVDLWPLFENPPGCICEEMFEDEGELMYKHTEEVLLWNDEGRRQLVDYLRGVLPRFSTPLAH